MTEAPLDLRRDRRARSALNAQLPGYGLTPGSARSRAEVVKAVTDSAEVRQRPLLLVLVAGLVAVVAFTIWVGLLWGVMTEEAPTGVAFWASLAVTVVAVYASALGWEFYDPGRALVTMWLILATACCAIAIIFVAILALRAKESVKASGLLVRMLGGSMDAGTDLPPSSDPGAVPTGTATASQDSPSRPSTGSHADLPAEGWSHEAAPAADDLPEPEERAGRPDQGHTG